MRNRRLLYFETGTPFRYTGKSSCAKGGGGGQRRMYYGGIRRYQARDTLGMILRRYHMPLLLYLGAGALLGRA